MKPKKKDKKTTHDLRDVASVRVAVPDVAEKFAGLLPVATTDGPDIVSPTVGNNEPPGQGSHG